MNVPVIPDYTSPIGYGCSCGIYAAKDYQHLQKICSSECVEAFVHGEVYLWYDHLVTGFTKFEDFKPYP